MFKWPRKRGGQEQGSVTETQQRERDSGEEEYQSEEELEEEVAPSGLTRAKTDKI